MCVGSAGGVDASAPPAATNGGIGSNGAGPFAAKKSASAFLGENSALVNLERLLHPASPDPPAPNPFANDAPRHMFQPPPPVTNPSDCHYCIKRSKKNVSCFNFYQIIALKGSERLLS